MAKYGEIIQKIEELQKEAARVRKQEVRAVVADIKKKIRQYDLSMDDLSDAFGKKVASKKRGRKPGRPASKKSGLRGKVAAKYRHPKSGDTWSGRGSVPKWLKAELAAGRKRDDFLIR